MEAIVYAVIGLVLGFIIGMFMSKGKKSEGEGAEAKAAYPDFVMKRVNQIAEMTGVAPDEIIDWAVYRSVTSGSRASIVFEHLMPKQDAKPGACDATGWEDHYTAGRCPSGTCPAIPQAKVDAEKARVKLMADALCLSGNCDGTHTVSAVTCKDKVGKDGSVWCVSSVDITYSGTCA